MKPKPHRTPRFNIRTYPRVPKWVIGLHVAFAEWLTRHYEVRHRIKVDLFPFISIETHDGSRCWGYFSNGNRAEIGLACRWPYCRKCKCRRYRRRRTRGYDRKCRDYLDCFAHEFVHYERWRDGRPQNHRGLQRRVDRLVRRFEEDYRK